MSDHKEAVQRTEAHGRNREETKCRDHFQVVVKEGQPLLRLIWLSLRSESPQVARHAGLGDVDTELEQFAADVGTTLARIIALHSRDQ